MKQMSPGKTKTSILQWLGPSGSGKTVLMDLLLPELREAFSVLIIDADPAGGISRLLLPVGTTWETVCRESSATAWLSGHLSSWREKPFEAVQEAIDWEVRNGLVSVSDEWDLFLLGPVAEPDAKHPELFSPENPDFKIARKAFYYGFSRLVQEYDLVLIDGIHPVLSGFMSKAEDWHHLPVHFCSLMVLNAAHTDLQETLRALHTAPEDLSGLLLNQCGDASRVHEEMLAEIVASADIRLVGRVPKVDLTREHDRQRLCQCLKDTLLRLDLPPLFEALDLDGEPLS
ncbi:MAG: hypothetical protein K2X01_07115 [Cyanobacteria bacterium]|nr:hypothetical protein [Cyanobacteriota bacterium]